MRVYTKKYQGGFADRRSVRDMSTERAIKISSQHYLEDRHRSDPEEI